MARKNGIDHKIKKLNDILNSLGRAVVAFSGGTDSSCVLASAVAQLGKENVIAVTASSEFSSDEELKMARGIARKIGATHVTVGIPVLKEVENNPADRCYRCKKKVFSRLLKFASDNEVKTVVDGTNADDAGIYRPGIKATGELGIISPLKEAGMTKPEVRIFAAKLKLPNANRPSHSCFATRFPYGEPLNVENIARVAEAEKYIGSLGFDELRVRSHNGLARIEVPQKDIKRLYETGDKIIRKLKKIGFEYITLDIEGFRSGSMDERLAKK